MPKSKTRILFVEDEIDLQIVIKMTLQDFKDIDGHIVSNATEALEVLSNDEIDVIVSDHYLPGMTGVELLEQIKEKYPNITRYLLTGSVDKTVFDKARNDADIKKIFEKPLILEDILQEIIGK